jgi:Glycosyltransferase
MTKDRPLCVAHNGVSASFRPVLPEIVENFKQSNGISKPYFLVCGRREKHKNAELFFNAFSTLPNKDDLAIVCCGGPPVLEPNLAEKVNGIDIHMIAPDDDVLNTAYNGAIALVYPSMYEGFGLPILEAMAAGCPVITCNNSSISEVGGDAVLYVGDSDSLEMQEALSRVQKQPIREGLIQAGLYRAPNFSWSKTASAISDFLDDILSRDLQNIDDHLENSGPLAFERWRDFRAYARECETMSPQLQAILSSSHLQKHMTGALSPADKMRELENAWLAAMDAQLETL